MCMFSFLMAQVLKVHYVHLVLSVSNELFLISHSSLYPAAANATILVALTRPYAQPLSQNAASVGNVSAIFYCM